MHGTVTKQFYIVLIAAIWASMPGDPLIAVTSDAASSRMKPAESPQMRIGIAIAESRKMAFRTETGGQREKWAYGTVVRKTLRARVAKDNHFYVKNWHLHTSPDDDLKSGKGKGVLTVSFYNSPDDGSLEELISTTRVVAKLSGSGGLLKFEGQEYSRIEPKAGRVAYDLVIGTPDSTKKWSSNLVAKYGAFQVR